MHKPFPWRRSPSAVPLAVASQSFARSSPAAAPHHAGRERSRRGNGKSSSLLQGPLFLPTANHCMESTCSGDRWCFLSLQCHHLALAKENAMAVRMRWLHECKTADFNTRNSNSPLCKVREQELFLTDIPLQFSCDGICVSLSGAQGQILLIKS